LQLKKRFSASGADLSCRLCKLTAGSRLRVFVCIRDLSEQACQMAFKQGESWLPYAVAATGAAALGWQIWKHFIERPRFAVDTKFSIHMNGSRAIWGANQTPATRELRIEGAATNRGNSRGYIELFELEISPECLVAFVNEGDEPQPVEARAVVKFECAVPVEFLSVIQPSAILRLRTTTGELLTKWVPTIGREALGNTASFSGPHVPPGPPIPPSIKTQTRVIARRVPAHSGARVDLPERK
jgi:hypothetical protein